MADLMPGSDVSMGTALVEMQDIWKQFHNGGRIDILTGAQVCIGAGESLAVVGASGIGKSTFLHILGTLERPDRGWMRFGGQDIFDFDEHRLAAFRNRSIGFVFQFHHLLPEFNALENAMMPAMIAGVSRLEARQAAEEVLVRVGLQDRLEHKVTTLSGGEQQRVALARALVRSPAMLLADEPTGNLDQKNSDRVHDLLMELNKDLAMTLVVVTHNLALADRMQRRITIDNGQLIEL